MAVLLGSIKTERYFVDYSSWFINHKYDIDKIKKAIKDAGGFNIRLAHNYGWSNQPKVVTFNGNEERVKKSIQKALNTDWIIIRKKDW